MRRSRRALPVAVAATLCVVPASAWGAQTGHSGWSWSSPAPQGHDLSDVVFTGERGYAVGAFGTLLRTADGGLTWDGLPSGTTANLDRVSALTDATPVLSGQCVIRRSTDGGLTLIRIPVGGGEIGCNSEVAVSVFTDALTGYVLLQDGTLLATADGGATFSRRTSLPDTVATAGASRPADMAAMGSSLLVAVAGRVYRSADAGSTWTAVASSAPGGRFTSLAVVSAQVAYALSRVDYPNPVGALYKTTDGGLTWTATSTPGGYNGQRLRCWDASLCLIATGATSLVRTADGGATFTVVTPSDVALNAVAFASATRAVAVGSGGATVVSDDAGVTWRTVSRRLAGTVTAVRSGRGPLTAWGLQGLVMTSTDRGATWVPGSVPASAEVRSASFPTATTGVALDATGAVWSTANAGVSWRLLDPGPPASLSEVLARSVTNIILVGPRTVRVSRDGGASFTQVGEPQVRAAGDLNRVFAVRTGVLVAGPTRILYSANGRTRWTPLPRPVYRGRAQRMGQIDCAPSGTCWATATGRLFATTNLGRTWRDLTAALPGPSRSEMRRLVVTDAKRGYVVLGAGGLDTNVRAGWVLRTVDGGATWTPQLLGLPELTDGDSGPAGDVVLGSGNAVFTTTTGGAAGTPTVLGVSPSTTVITRPTTVTVTVRLRGAVGGERVVLSSSRFRSQVVTVASTGTAQVNYRVTGTTTFVAHWGGDGTRQGDGSPVVTVRRR